MPVTVTVSVSAPVAVLVPVSPGRGGLVVSWQWNQRPSSRVQPPGRRNPASQRRPLVVCGVTVALASLRSRTSCPETEAHPAGVNFSPLSFV